MTSGRSHLTLGKSKAVPHAWDSKGQEWNARIEVLRRIAVGEEPTAGDRATLTKLADELEQRLVIRTARMRLDDAP